MRAILCLLAAAASACGADIKNDDGWVKVKELKSGTDLRIFKKGVAQPLLAKAADATDDKLIVVLKNEETAIDKKDIERVDARPQNVKRPVTKTITTTDSTTRHDTVPGPPGYSSSVSVGSKPDFETVYQRRTGAK
jgi:hypothetical protein